MAKKSVILVSVLLTFTWILRFPEYSLETGGDGPVIPIARTSFSQFQLKSSSAKVGEPIRLDRRRSASQDIYWIRSYRTDRNDYIYSIKQTIDGGYLAAGMSYGVGNGSTEAVLIKLDPEGAVEWQKSYGGERADGFWNTTFVEASDGSYVVATDTESFGAGKRDVWILKLSIEGNIIWQKTYGRANSDDDAAGGITQTRDGGYIITGSSGSHEITEGILVLKIDAAGNILWDKIFSGYTGQWGDSVLQAVDGGYIIGAGIYGIYGASPYIHPAILKLDRDGNIEWQKFYEGFGRNWPYYTIVRATLDGGYIVADYGDPTRDGNEDFWVFKLDSTGNITWQNLYGGSGWDRIGRALCQTRDGGYAVAGYTNSYGRGSFDGWILKLDPNGHIVWQKTYGENFAEIFFALHQKSNGEFLAAGYCLRAGDEMLIMKVSEEGDIGGGDNWVLDSTAVATPTTTVPAALRLRSVNAGLISNFSNSSATDISLDQEVLSWNLHQPPVNVSVRTEMNRSLFFKEFYNILSWQPNPFNDQFTIAEYKIYRRISGEPYEYIKTVAVGTTEYMELIPATGEVLEYAVTSVDSEGRESPKSFPVKSS